MDYTARTHGLADRAVKNMAVQLAERGALPPEAARQMCDGFVSPTNLRQAEQAMVQARADGDPTSFQFAKNLHFALQVQMQFQDPSSTRREAQGDAFERQGIDGNDGFGGDSGVPDCFPGGRDTGVLGRNGDVGTGLLVGGLFAAAVLMMSRGRNNNGNQHNNQRVERQPVHQHAPPSRERQYQQQMQQARQQTHQQTNQHQHSTQQNHRHRNDVQQQTHRDDHVPVRQQPRPDRVHVDRTRRLP